VISNQKKIIRAEAEISNGNAMEFTRRELGSLKVSFQFKGERIRWTILKMAVHISRERHIVAKLSCKPVWDSFTN